MRKKTASPILLQPIQRMEVSNEFKAMARANGYRTLRDIFHGQLSGLPKKELSGYRMLRELLDVLEANDLRHLMEEDMHQ